ncbi:MAG: tetratricopeptide repeat protein [Capsulimonas sp.]|uniref:tetratricopeptide repeat protein n=1 Tax=Capsulimonas sp. TaxID=2494211 RepID=UPI003266799D
MEEAANRFRRACDHYERALPLATGSELKSQLYAKLAIANFNAGDIADTIRWAETGIADQATGKTLTVLHSIAGLGYRNLGDLASALAHDQRHYELVVAEGNPKRISEALVKLASLESYQGKFQSALELCERAHATFPQENRIVGITEHEILKLLGRFAEARRALIQSRGATPAFIPRLEDRTSGATELALSKLAAEAGDAREAREAYAVGRAALEGDDKLMVFADALHAWILALEGAGAESADQIVYAEGRSANVAGSASTLRDIFTMLTWAALIIGDYRNARRYAERYLELRPYPAYATIAYYQVGEAYLGLGDTAQAADAYERVIALNCATYASGQAIARLEQIRQTE